MSPIPQKTNSQQPQENAGKTGVSSEWAAVGAAAKPETAAIDPDLQAVIQAWPGLPTALRAGIVAMVKAADPQT